ncbi:MAG TPA: hypothetical protein VG892_14175 [Terriglobales bacterium]|nr:hypothetical protein [Terriglobales bacterium]
MNLSFLSFRKPLLLSVLLSLAAMAALAATAPNSEPPSWAFVVSPTPPPIQDDGSVLHVPGSSRGFSLSEVKALFGAPDWHPDEHPAMPNVVATGRAPDVRPCAYCHLPNGLGRPENASLAGLSPAYIKQQVADFKSGARKSSQPNLNPPNLMIGVAKHVTDADLDAAANYFASLKPMPWIKVVESNTIPKTRINGGMLMPALEGGTEPIGNRIVEIPDDVARTELRDSQSAFTAYVPVGSIQRGEMLVATGGAKVVAGKIVPGKTIQCGICHGADLRGLAAVPRLAGRSPSYLMRQLYDIQHGSRAGPWTGLMQGVVAHLDQNDLIDIVAYLSSRTP